jgi:dTDP-4-amino-4,6-dideoxygalactose transaminase
MPQSSRVPLVDLKAQYHTLAPQIQTALQRVLDSTHFILGREVAQFEEAFAAYLGVRGVAGVATGTAALMLAFRACDIGPGDEVITTAHTFWATGEAIFNVGATPVFSDIDPMTYNINPALVEAAITNRTKAIVPVHLYGQPADMDALMRIAARRKLLVIEDACQAHGAEYKGRKCGSMGVLGCFSFYPGKNLGAYGDAGAVAGRDPALLDRVRSLRDHGRSSKYEHPEVGYGERMDGFQGAVLGVKLPHLDEWNRKRKEHAARYRQLLKGLPVKPPVLPPGVASNYHLYVIRAPKRDALLYYLKQQDIESGIHYPIPMHRQPGFLKQGIPLAPLPETEKAAAEVISLPMYAELTEDQIERVVDHIGNFYRSAF